MFSLVCVVVGGVHGACCLPVTWSVELELELGYFIIGQGALCAVCVLCV